MMKQRGAKLKRRATSARLYLVLSFVRFRNVSQSKAQFQSIALKILTPIPLPVPVSGKTQEIEPVIESISASDDSFLACRVWKGLPDRSVVLYLHGIEGHSQWFVPTADVLNAHGMTVYAPDRRGSGLNPGDRGHLVSLKVFLHDVENLLRQIRARHPSQPIILFANCWSAKAAAVITRRNHVYFDKAAPVKLAGLIMTCPAILTKADFNLVSKIKIAINSFGGNTASRRTFPVPLTTEMLTDNPSYIDYLHNDPLRLKFATASFFRETFILGLLAQMFAKQIDLPLLLLQAENDQIVDIDKLKTWFEKVNSKEKTWHCYGGATHSLDFDAFWFDDYTTLLTNWITERSQAVKAS